MPFSDPNPPRHVGFPSGSYIKPSPANGCTTRAVPAAATAWAFPFNNFPPTAFDRIALNLITQQVGGACRVGAYTSAGGVPAALIVDGGEIDLSVSPALVTATIAAILTPPFWIIVWTNGTASISVSGATGVTGSDIGVPAALMVGSGGGAASLGLAAAYPGAMPATAPAVTAAGGSLLAPMPFLRVT